MYVVPVNIQKNKQAKRQREKPFKNEKKTFLNRLVLSSIDFFDQKSISVVAVRRVVMQLVYVMLFYGRFLAGFRDGTIFLYQKGPAMVRSFEK